MAEPPHPPRDAFDSSVEGVLGDIRDELGFDAQGDDGAPLSEVAESLHPAVDDDITEADSVSMFDDLFDNLVSHPNASDALLQSFIGEQPAGMETVPPVDDELRLISTPAPRPADDLLARYLSDASLSADPAPSATTRDASRVEAPGASAATSRSAASVRASSSSAAPKRTGAARAAANTGRGIMPYALAAAAAVVLAVTMYVVRHRNNDAEPSDAHHAPAPPNTAAAPAEPAKVPELPTAREVAPTSPPNADPKVTGDGSSSKLVIDIHPRNAYAQFAEAGVPDGPKYAGPWPRFLEVAPGTYQLVVFRHGFKTVQREVTIPAESKVTTVHIQLLQDDIDNE